MKGFSEFIVYYEGFGFNFAIDDRQDAIRNG
jgi:hypothetical protein